MYEVEELESKINEKIEELKKITLQDLIHPTHSLIHQKWLGDLVKGVSTVSSVERSIITKTRKKQLSI